MFNIALLGTAILDWDSWVLPRPASLIIGGGWRWWVLSYSVIAFA
jgi:hypothetical protein